MVALPDNWNKMIPDEKLNTRLAGWISTEGKEFETSKAAKEYRERTQRYADILRLQQPDRVPRLLSAGDFVAHYAGVSQGDMFYNYSKAVKAFIKFHEDFDLDYSASGNFMPGKVFERLDYRLYRIPCHTLLPTQSFQFVEGEYMYPDEYDALIANPEGFLMRTYIPRVMGTLGGWSLWPNMLGSTELPFVPFMMANFSIPPLQESLKALTEAAQAVSEWLDASGQVRAFTLGKLGLPGTAGCFTKAPFDYLGDSLRGTRGIMMDLFRMPQKVLAAEDCLVLNVWTPANDNKKRPVMFYNHGGGFSQGSAGSVAQDGANLARNFDVIVVQTNHRLGLLVICIWMNWQVKNTRAPEIEECWILLRD